MSQGREYAVKCTCGHIGKILVDDVDINMWDSWEHYTLSNLKGHEFKSEIATWDEVFNHMQPKCPKCKQSLSPDHLQFNDHAALVAPAIRVGRSRKKSLMEQLSTKIMRWLKPR